MTLTFEQINQYVGRHFIKDGMSAVKCCCGTFLKIPACALDVGSVFYCHTCSESWDMHDVLKDATFQAQMEP